jgi:hypothetical protein
MAKVKKLKVTQLTVQADEGTVNVTSLIGQIEAECNALERKGYEIVSVVPINSVVSATHSSGYGAEGDYFCSVTVAVLIISRKKQNRNRAK